MGFWKNLVNVGKSIAKGIPVIGEAVGVADSIAGLFGQSSDQRYNTSQLQAQNAFNAQQAELNRQFQMNMMQQNFDMVNQYNTPANQMERLRQAGLNPFSSQGQAYSASSTSSSPTSPSGSTAVGSAPAYTQSSFASRWSDLASASHAIAQADRAGIDTEFLKETLKARIDNETARSEIQQVLSKYQNEMSKKELDLITQKIQETIENWQNISSETDANHTWRQWLALSQKNKYLKDTEVQDVMRSIYQNYRSNWQDELYTSEINKNASVTAVNQSQEKLNNTRQALAHLEELVAKATNESEKFARLKEFEEAAERQGLITESLRQTLRTLEKNNDWYGFNMVLKTLGVGADVYNATKKGKGSGNKQTVNIFDSYYY